MLALPLFIIVSLSFGPIFADQNAIIAVEADDVTNGDVTVDVDENEQETFVPTKEWQKIKPGQSIPAGLHIKVNLQSGKKEAKILDNEKITGHHYELQDENEDKKDTKKFSPQELKEALKKFKTEEADLKLGNEINEQTKAKFRSIDELKKDFQSMKVNVKSQSEIVIDLIRRYRTATESEKLIILQDMEYFVHQYDTAQDFVKLKGLELLIPDLNSTDSKVRELVAFVIGSALQGNPQVQIAVLEQNAMQKLLRLVAFDPSHRVRAKSLYAISCLVRQFPFAQRRLIENGGLTTFAELFKDLRPEMQILQLKVVVLLHDLITEHQLALKYSTKKYPGTKEKILQYSQFNIVSLVVENDFCRLVPKLLPSPDYDTQEKVVGAMIELADFCGNAFSHKLSALKQLAELYETTLARDNDDYVDSLHQSVTNLISKMERNARDEL